MAGNNSYPTPSGTIAMSDLNSALGQSSTASISFSDSRVRFLSNQDSGSVSMSAMRNKFYSDGNVGPIYWYSSKGYSYQSGNAYPLIFGCNGTQTNINSDSDNTNWVNASSWASNIGLGGRSYRLQVNNGVIYTLTTTEIGRAHV